MTLLTAYWRHSLSHTHFISMTKPRPSKLETSTLPELVDLLQFEVDLISNYITQVQQMLILFKNNPSFIAPTESESLVSIQICRNSSQIHLNNMRVLFELYRKSIDQDLPDKEKGESSGTGPPNGLNDELS